MQRFNNAVNALESLLTVATKSIAYIDQSNAPSTYKEMCEAREYLGFFLVYNGACDKTIFSSPKFNVMFRAFHDEGHYRHGLSFKFAEEKQLGCIQAMELYNLALKQGYSSSEAFDVFTLVYVEIVCQIEFYEINKRYVDNQREFTRELFYKHIDIDRQAC